MKMKYSTFYSNVYSKVEIIINDLDIDSVFESIYSMIITKIKKYQAKARMGLLVLWYNKTLTFQKTSL